MDQDTNGLVAAAGEGSGALPSTFKYRVAENTSGAATETYKVTEATEFMGIGVTGFTPLP